MKYVPKVHLIFQPAAKTNLSAGQGTFPVTYALWEALHKAVPGLAVDVRLLHGKVELDQSKSLEALGIKNDDVLILTY